MKIVRRPIAPTTSKGLVLLTTAESGVIGRIVGEVLRSQPKNRLM